MGYIYNYNSRDRIEAISKEMFELKKKYGFNRNVMLSWTNIYTGFTEMKLGSITKNIEFLMKAFVIIGLSDEEKINFIEHNKDVVTADSVYLKQTCVVLQNFGLLKDALLRCPSLVSRSFSSNNINVRDFYALLCSEDIDDVMYLKNRLYRMSLEERANFRRIYYLDNDKMREMNDTFNRALRVSHGLRLEK